ncbi:membrane protein [Bryobacterales bacterium F-183]|nr:membrane protein [Bryobacterales bacterium F-183]
MQALSALLYLALAFEQLTIQDPSGAPVPNAACRVEGTAVEVRSNASGVCDIAATTGKVRVTRPGFRPVTVDVKTGQPAKITLELDPMRYSADVIGSTPLPGAEITANDVPAPVQTANAADIERSGALDLSDLMNRRLNGVYFNEIQNNPYQPDVNYRGYTASPLLGTPQGLSVYMDGVRLNEPFGDIVSWDLIPRAAISEVALMPGSNPIFGLNTLGGALSIQTKDGFTAPRSSITGYFGKFGRKAGEFEHGGSHINTGYHWYATGNLFGEDGWRDASPSTVRQIFGKFGRQMQNTSWSLSLAHANNALIGNGLQEKTFLERDYASIHTKPDATNHKAQFLNFQLRHNFTSRFTASGNAYYRRIRTSTLNGDINEDSLDQSVYQPNAAERAALAAAGYTGFPTSGENASNTPFPFWRCLAQVLLRDEPAEKCNGLLNRTGNIQHNSGVSGQATWFSSRNQLTIGAAYDHSRSSFTQLAQLGYLTPDRGVVGVPAFGDGVTGGDVDGEPFDTRVDLNGRLRTSSVYASNLFRAAPGLNITLAGRFNTTNILNRDRILPLGGPGSLNGDHTFTRFNPSVGLTYTAAELVNVYFSYSEGSRSPTSIELGCADPEQPCKLPNAMAADPPLNQVVTRTLEGGVRGGTSASLLNWNAGWFRAANRDDILFVAAPQTGYGYFRNFGQTLRQGAQFDARLRFRRLLAGFGYTFLDAQFRSEETVNGESNSSADDELIEIEPGARMPLTPRHIGKFYADILVTNRLTLDLGFQAASSSIARGNENNEHRPDGVFYLGDGRAAGYGVASLGARFKILNSIEWFGQINNLFDKQYVTAAQLGPFGFNPTTQAFVARPFPQQDGEFPIRNSTFYAPGMPRMLWTGLKIRF